MIISSKTYDVLKYICTIGLPAFLTCLSTILALCGVETNTIAIIIGIGTAINTLLGTLLGISTHSYNKAINEELAEYGEVNEG